MALTEAMRHRLFEHFEQLMGPDEAEAMMELLPPVGWADVATKRDLDGLGRELRAEIATLRSDLRAEMHQSQKQLLLAVLAANAGMAATFAGIAFAAARLA